MKISTFIARLRFRLWSQRDAIVMIRPQVTAVETGLISRCPGTFTPISKKNIYDCAAFEDSAHYVPLYQEMLERGDYGHYGYLNGVCVYREWLQRSGDIHFDGCHVMQLQENEGYSCYVYCDPNARGNGFQAAGVAAMAEYFPMLTFYTIVLVEKEITRKNYLKNGYVPHHIITVKNRFFFRKIVKRELSEEEAKTFYI